MTDFDGGPAFPLATSGTVASAHHNGMTLRDYFAAKAMQGEITGLVTGGTLLCLNLQEIAVCAYSMADEMLAARIKEQTK